MFTKSRLTFAVGLIFASGIQVSLAEEQVAEGSSERATLEEVIVTAERREASLQSTAVAVTAMTQEALTENDISDVTDLSGFVPNLVVSGQEDQSVIKIKQNVKMLSLKMVIYIQNTLLVLFQKYLK